MKRKKGLTLIELLAVIAIIAILFVLLIPSISSAIDKARISGVQMDFRSYQVAAQAYHMEKEGAKTEQEYNQYLDKELRFENGKSKELNAWDEPYEYIQDGEDFKVITKQGNGEEANQFEISFEDRDGTFEQTLEGFEKENIIEVGTNEEQNNGNVNNEEQPEEPSQPINPNDLDNDGWDDNTHLPLGVTANTDKSAFNTSDSGRGDGSIMITAYMGTLKEVVIPPYLDGKKVVKIEKYAFYPKAVNSNLGKSTGPQITHLVLPNTVTEISNFAFNSNRLVSVTLPNSLEIIENGAFVTNLLTTLKIPKSVTFLPGASFTQNPNLKQVQNCSNIEITTQFNSDPVVTTEGC